MITGLPAEKVFEEIMSKRDTVRASTKEENMHCHIDFFVGEDSYDVKGEKRMDRRENDNDDTVWIEKTNVRGNTGWLYGKATYIAFLIKDEFWVVDRLRLVQYIESEVTCETIFPIKRYKKWYSRNNRKDAITYVYPRDIEKLVKEKIKI